jgi:cation diffusion facilitator CzcD-associated flavoprotein CzcO
MAAPTLIVGAGPGGLAAARAFKLFGVPYVQVERHGDVGGIWDADNPGSPIYESAHFISSKTCSAFHGMPMPAACRSSTTCAPSPPRSGSATASVSTPR